MSTGEAVLMMAIGFVIAIPVLLLLVVSGHRGGGTQPIGKVSDTPPRPTLPPPRRTRHPADPPEPGSDSSPLPGYPLEDWR